MAMAPKLQMKQGQQLAMTPQLQQAIKLLQLSNIELAAFVEEQLESNPLLERGTGDENRRGEAPETTGDDTGSLAELNLSAPNADAVNAIDAPATMMDTEVTVSELAPSAPSVGGEIDWSKAGSGGSFNGGEDYDRAANTAEEITLIDHLNAQLAMACHDDFQRIIGGFLINHVDENGYLRVDLGEIADGLGASFEDVERVLRLLQTFEPTGVMARSLGECLSLQLEEKGELNAPMQILLGNLELLAKQDLEGLAKLTGLSGEGLRRSIKQLKALSPKPGLAYGSEAAAPVEPDVFVRETPEGGWAVELNSDTLPRVLVNSRYYTEIVSDNKDEGVNSYMSECHQNASWLVKSLDQRARTILKVAGEIVKQQDGFFVEGVNALRPLNLKTVADAIEMHESTISRVTSNKFMSTPRGVFELKYFFTASISSSDGGDAHSAEAVRHKIKILIDEEKVPKDVLSDDKIVDMLKAQGIFIARRTVAKYRDSLGIGSSVHRRRALKNNL